MKKLVTLVNKISRLYSTVTNQSSKITLLDIRKKYERNEPIVMVTSYDYTSAQLIEKSNSVDIILVGDSLGMVMLGHSDTSSVTMEEMIHHCKAVKRGSSKCFVIGDMPMGSYESSDEDAVRNAIRLIKEGKVHAVKCEGGKRIASRIKAITNAGIPVMAHIGLTPQTQSALGGFRVQGKTAKDALLLLEDAKAVEACGSFGIVIESVPLPVSELLTSSVSIPTIGIGAGNKTSGQVLVWHDMFGINSDFQPKLSKIYKNIGEEIINGIKEYSNEVSHRIFPGLQNSYTMKKYEWDKLKEIQLQLVHKNDDKISKVAIVGGGAMGSVFGANFGLRQDIMTWIVSGWTDHVKAINKYGLELVTVEGEVKRARNIRATSDPEECLNDKPCDLVLVAVKSYQTIQAAHKAKILFSESEEALAMTIQNGFGNFEILEDVLGKNRVLQGTTSYGGMMLAPGKVKLTGIGENVLAVEPNFKHKSKVSQILRLLISSGLTTETVDDIESLLWSKLIINSGINPVTAIMKITNGEALHHPEAYKLIVSATKEAYNVAFTRGVKILWDNPIDKVTEVLQKTSYNKSSMLQDVLRGCETEIDSINEKIVIEAEQLGINVPVNQMLCKIIKSIRGIPKFDNGFCKREDLYV